MYGFDILFWIVSSKKVVDGSPEDVKERKSDEKSERSSDGGDDGRQVEEEAFLDDRHVRRRVHQPKQSQTMTCRFVGTFCQKNWKLFEQTDIQLQ